MHHAELLHQGHDVDGALLANFVHEALQITRGVFRIRKEPITVPHGRQQPMVELPRKIGRNMLCGNERDKVMNQLVDLKAFGVFQALEGGFKPIDIPNRS